MDFHEVAQKAIGDMPPETRFRPEDAEVIKAHADLILPLAGEFVTGFYDMLFAHEPTRAVFEEGERAEREKTLADFLAHVVNGPHDDEFFAWLAFVGPVHVVRQVSNPMMLAMLDYLVLFIMKKFAGHENAAAVTEAFVRLAATLGSIITYGYEVAWQEALQNVVGMPPALVQRMVHEEAQRMFPLRSHGQA
ncbi:protoglobin domain-containing protein [Oceanithermus sp.]